MICEEEEERSEGDHGTYYGGRACSDRPRSETVHIIKVLDEFIRSCSPRLRTEPRAEILWNEHKDVTCRSIETRYGYQIENGFKGME